MGRQSNNIDKTKKEAPPLPGDTCPYIDFIKSIVDEIRLDSDCDLDTNRLDLIEPLIEYVRGCNEQLRDNSKYWYQNWLKCQK